MCVAAAGFSVGEFAALVFSGAMDFAEGKHPVLCRTNLWLSDKHWQQIALIFHISLCCVL